MKCAHDARHDLHTALMDARDELAAARAENAVLKRLLAEQGIPFTPQHQWRPAFLEAWLFECSVCGTRARATHDVAAPCREVGV